MGVHTCTLYKQISLLGSWMHMLVNFYFRNWYVDQSSCGYGGQPNSALSSEQVYLQTIIAYHYTADAGTLAQGVNWYKLERTLIAA